MQNAVFLNLPSSVRDYFSEKKILQHLLQETLGKKEFFAGQENFFIEKYGLSLSKFKKRNLKKEKFEEWDDLMEWEACHLAANEWNKKYRDLLHCWKSSKK